MLRNTSFSMRTGVKRTSFRNFGKFCKQRKKNLKKKNLKRKRKNSLSHQKNLNTPVRNPQTWN